MFSEQLFHSFDYTVLFVNDRIVKYALTLDKKANSAWRLIYCLTLNLFIMTNEKCLFDIWSDGEKLNLNKFTVTLFQLFQFADGNNRQKILDTWPEYFTDSVNI